MKISAIKIVSLILNIVMLLLLSWSILFYKKGVTLEIHRNRKPKVILRDINVRNVQKLKETFGDHNVLFHVR